ncbi:MAG: DUF1573 domain-containing protein [Gemmataceae bacterium]|nr:DUF1573 domain-containing protein [Gemmataceae bacterium]
MLCLLILLPIAVDRADADRGPVRIGPPLVHEFRLTNHGATPVELLGAKSTCGCLAPKLDRTRLSPGESATLAVEVNTLSQPAGPVAWTTTVRWRSAEGEGDTPVILRATLISEVTVEPAALAFHVRRARSTDVIITDKRDKPFRVTASGANVAGLTTELRAGPDARSHIIRVTASADAPAGTTQSVVWLTTDDPAYPQIRVPVTLHVPAKTRVVASPSTVFLNGTSPVRILLRDPEGQPVRIERVDVDGPVAATVASAIVTVQADAKKWDGQPAGAKISIRIAGPVAETVFVNIDLR